MMWTAARPRSAPRRPWCGEYCRRGVQLVRTSNLSSASNGPEDGPRRVEPDDDTLMKSTPYAMSERCHPRPYVLRGPAGPAMTVEASAAVQGSRRMTRLMDPPPERMPGRAPGVIGADVAPGSQVGRRLRRLRWALAGAAVVVSTVWISWQRVPSMESSGDPAESPQLPSYCLQSAICGTRCNKIGETPAADDFAFCGSVGCRSIC